MRSQIKLGKIFGIEIGLHYSWFLIALLIVYSLSSQFHASNPGWGDQVILTVAIATAILFFVSLLLHELAHSLVATSHGLPVREITLFALGGVSQIEKNPTSAKLEFWMAFVGPLTSVIIGGICVGLARAIGQPSSDPWMAMLQWLGYINLMLASFQPDSRLSSRRRPRIAGHHLVEDGQRRPLHAIGRENRPGGCVRFYRGRYF